MTEFDLGSRIGEMCKGCINQDHEKGCQLPWILRRGQEKNAKAGFCNDYVTQNENGELTSGTRVMIKKDSWITQPMSKDIS